MRVFISYSHQDKVVVEKIISRLKIEGHDIWVDSIKLRPGDNFSRKIEEGLEQADALIVVISYNSFRSKWVQAEFSAIALQQISKRERRIIPVKIDRSEVPGYLADRIYLDLSENFEAGLERLIELLRVTTPESLGTPREPIARTAESRVAQIEKLCESLRRGRLTLVCGAGISVEAGIPAWGDLLIRLLGTMMEHISKDYSLDVGKKAAAEFQRRQGASSLILGKYLKNNLGRDFQSEMRDALYASKPTSSPIIDSVVRLSRPQRDGRPLDSIITFNFDCLIEENLSVSSIPNRPIFSEAIKHGAHELPIYHVHGYLPRTGRIPPDMELVFSEDAYHSQFIDPFSWSNLIQLNKLTQNTCLFIGISLTDPNMRRLLDVAWRKNPDKVLSHYIVKRLPQSSEGDVLDDVSKLLEEQDANALGLNVVWLDDFAELPKFINDISVENSP
jgi:hypothetical protein